MATAVMDVPVAEKEGEMPCLPFWTTEKDVEMTVKNSIGKIAIGPNGKILFELFPDLQKRLEKNFRDRYFLALRQAPS